MKIYIFTLIIAGIFIDPLIADEDITIQNTLESLMMNEENLAPSLPRQKKSYATISPRNDMKKTMNRRYTSIFVEPLEMKHYTYYKPTAVVHNTKSYSEPAYSKPVYAPPPAHEGHATVYSASEIHEEPDYKNSVYDVPVHEEQHYDIPAPKYSKPTYVAPPDYEEPHYNIPSSMYSKPAYADSPVHEEQHYDIPAPKYSKPTYVPPPVHDETYYNSPITVYNKEPVYHTDYSHTMPCPHSLLISCNPSVSEAPCGYYETPVYHQPVPIYYPEAPTYYVPRKSYRAPIVPHFVPVIAYHMSSHHHTAPGYSVAAASAVATSQSGNGNKKQK